MGGPLLRSFASWLMAGTMAVAPIAAARAAACYTPAETTAVEVRMLQSELMVAALACRDSNPELGMLQQYNEFVRRLSVPLVRHSKVLQAHFRRAYGTSGMSRLEAFETALANDASKRSMVSASYCHRAAAVFQEVSALKRTDLERFSAERATEVGLPVRTCTATAAAR